MTPIPTSPDPKTRKQLRRAWFRQSGTAFYGLTKEMSRLCASDRADRRRPKRKRARLEPPFKPEPLIPLSY